jgi:hypothetical protein
LLQSLCGFAPSQSQEISPDFFCSHATLVQIFCSDVSGEVSGKITSPEKICYDASIVQKNCSDVSGEVSGKICFVLLRTVFCYNEAKTGIFASRKQFRGFYCKMFLLHSYKRIATMNRFLLH